MAGYGGTRSVVSLRPERRFGPGILFNSTLCSRRLSYLFLIALETQNYPHIPFFGCYKRSLAAVTRKLTFLSRSDKKLFQTHNPDKNRILPTKVIKIHGFIPV